MNTAERIARLQEQILQAPVVHNDVSLGDWITQTNTLLRMFIGEGSENYKKFRVINYAQHSPEQYKQERFEKAIVRAKSLLRAAITEVQLTADMSSGTALVPEPGNEIFVVHGHAEALRHSVVDFLRKVTGSEPTVLLDEPNKGMTLFEKFEDAAERACFAVVLATADDIGRAKTAKDDSRRARQNVILEWGFFAGRLGRNRVALMCEQDVELPSDTSGLVYIQLDPAGAWKLGLAKELKAASIEVSLDRAI